MAAYPTVPPPDPGTVALLISPASVRLVLAGEHDTATKAELLEAVHEAMRYGRKIEVDTRHVTFMDASAIATLSGLIQSIGHRPVFISPSEVVRFLLDVTKIGQLVDIVHEVADFPVSTTVGA